MAKCGAEHPDLKGIFCNLSPRLHPEHTGMNEDRYFDWPNELYVPSLRVKTREDRQKIKALAQRIRSNK